jgi:hypothetical protein
MDIGSILYLFWWININQKSDKIYIQRKQEIINKTESYLKGSLPGIAVN